nr:NDP-sugar synthase [Nocardia aurea]
MSGVAAVLLCAGMGARLRPLTDSVAKPLAPILNTPLLYWNIAALSDSGIGTLVANVYTKSHQFELAAAKLREKFGIGLILVHERSLSGPAGGLVECASAVSDVECYAVVSGDAFTQLNFVELLDTYRSSGADMAIVVTRVLDTDRFGVVQLRGDDVVGIEDWTVATPAGAFVNCGIYVISPKVLSWLNPSGVAGSYDFKHVIPTLLSRGCSIRAYQTTAYWDDVGTVDSLRRANLWALSSDMASRVATSVPIGDGRLWVQGTRAIGRGVILKDDALVGAGAIVGDDVVLSNSVVGTWAKIGVGARLSDSLIMPGAVVPPGSIIHGKVVT